MEVAYLVALMDTTAMELPVIYALALVQLASTTLYVSPVHPLCSCRPINA